MPRCGKAKQQQDKFMQTTQEIELGFAQANTEFNRAMQTPLGPLFIGALTLKKLTALFSQLTAPQIDQLIEADRSMRVNPTLRNQLTLLRDFMVAYAQSQKESPLFSTWLKLSGLC